MMTAAGSVRLLTSRLASHWLLGMSPSSHPLARVWASALGWADSREHGNVNMVMALCLPTVGLHHLGRLPRAPRRLLPSWPKLTSSYGATAAIGCVCRGGGNRPFVVTRIACLMSERFIIINTPALTT